MTLADKKVLVVLTSHDQLGDTGEKTGFWLEEFAAPYYVLLDAGVSVTLVSPAGGQPPIDATSELADFQTDATRRFDNDARAQHVLASTLKLSDINSDDFDAVFYPGGHGPLWDLVDNQHSLSLISDLLRRQKPVASVCHATAALLNVKDDNGNFYIAGKSVTGFSNSEEDAVQLTDVVPYLLEDELKARGGDYQKVADWAPFVVQDGLLITGQNPASSDMVAQALLKAL